MCTQPETHKGRERTRETKKGKTAVCIQKRGNQEIEKNKTKQGNKA